MSHYEGKLPTFPPQRMSTVLASSPLCLVRTLSVKRAAFFTQGQIGEKANLLSCEFACIHDSARGTARHCTIRSVFFARGVVEVGDK